MTDAKPFSAAELKELSQIQEVVARANVLDDWRITAIRRLLAIIAERDWVIGELYRWILLAPHDELCAINQSSSECTCGRSAALAAAREGTG